MFPTCFYLPLQSRFTGRSSALAPPSDRPSPIVGTLFHSLLANSLPRVLAQSFCLEVGGSGAFRFLAVRELFFDPYFFV